MTRRLRLKAMREAAATARAFVESDTGKRLRETATLFSDSDVCKKLRQSITGLDLDHLRADALAAHAKEAKQALASLTADDDESDAPALRPRRKGGRPVEHDWIGAKQYLDDWLKTNDLPPVKKRMEELLRDWFKKNDGDAPDDRQISRKLIDPLYQVEERQNSR